MIIRDIFSGNDGQPNAPTLQGSRMTIEDVAYVEAPRSVVWEVTRDVEQWPSWTPTVKSVTLLGPGPLRLGSVARIKQPLQRESDWVVTEYVDGHRFAWATRRLGLTMTGTHELTDHEGGTKNLLRVDVGGIAAVLLKPLLRLAVQRALSDENRGLKERCEEIVANSIAPDAEVGSRGRLPP